MRKVPGLVGYINDIRWYSRDVQNVRIEGLEILLSDNTGWSGTLQIGSKSGKAFQFLKLAENIDYLQPVEISVWKGRDKEKNKDQAAFTVRQNGEIVRWKYTAANPGKMPEGNKNRRGEWDFSDQEAWLIDLLEQRIRPLAQAARTERESDDAPVPQAQAMAALRQAAPEPFDTYDDSDIPF